MGYALNIVLLGGGLGCYELLTLIEDLNKSGSCETLIDAILDDDESVREQWKLKGFRVGKFDQWSEMADGCKFVVAFGNFLNRLTRPTVVEELGIPIEKYTALAHPTAVISSDVSLPPGSIIHAKVCIYPKTELGNFSVISAGSVIGVDNRIGAHCLIGANVTTATGVMLGTSVMLGAGVTVAPDVHMEDGSMAGVGSVVFRNVDRGIQVLGNPARPYARGSV